MDGHAPTFQIWSSDWTQAPRDGRYVWLLRKERPDSAMRLRWSTSYSVFGLGGCWTDGLCTMGEGIDFSHWIDLPEASP